MSFAGSTLGIGAGTTLEFSAREGVLIAHKTATDPVAAVFGCLGRKLDTDRFIRQLRGDKE